MKKFNLRVKKEEYIESHTDNMDKEVHRRTMIDDENGIKLVLESPEPIDFLKRGEEITATFENPQKRLTDENES